MMLVIPTRVMGIVALDWICKDILLYTKIDLLLAIALAIVMQVIKVYSDR